MEKLVLTNGEDSSGQSYVPQKGDIFIFPSSTTNPFGHVAVASEACDTGVTLSEMGGSGHADNSYSLNPDDSNSAVSVNVTGYRPIQAPKHDETAEAWLTANGGAN
ncbi:hypothetical protein DID80_00785 [Candidatus Marinamargulisbacteria bacterium SCGC AAA071-K20]|nr:hypothetical protein DID80_00785 [Candidatus Marinamargulisbacteria bacterium SCGC AAA071-K20]